MTLTIRNVKEDDLEKVVAIESEAFQMSEEMTRRDMIGRIENYPDTFLVAEKDGKVVGHVFGPASEKMYIADEMYFKNHPNKSTDKYQMILSLAVDKKYRKQGIATKLVNDFCDRAKDANRELVSLICYPKLIKFYEKCGFINKGKTSGDIPDPENQSSYNMVNNLK